MVRDADMRGVRGSAPRGVQGRKNEMNTMDEIGSRIITQDGRGTAVPMYCVQVCHRIGPLLDGYCGNQMIHDHISGATYYDDDKENAKKFRRLSALIQDGRHEDRYAIAGYANVWMTVAVCFTEAGCQQHLELNGHNYRHHHGTRIYAESWYRNPEMEAVRDMLIASADQNKAGKTNTESEVSE